ncbi:glycosyltransferase [Desertivirga brevis]|uniref:glycosyltransferase n=1 Tax=Desertivirga brevis TaxID=2810310 RepID=UPI001A958880|nr:glycosyltransferase [Pedobacter sp. SYSU D00873]
MYLLHLIGSMNPSSGGPCQGIRNSIPILEQRGIFREVVSLDDPTSDFIGKDKFPIHALGPGKSPWCYSEKLIPWLRDNICRFDVIIVNGLWLYHSYAVTKVIKQLEGEIKRTGSSLKLPKLFIMPHGMLDPYFQRAPERKLKAFRNWLYWKLIEVEVVNRASGVLFTCETELLLARETFDHYKPKKELNIGYGIEKPPMYNERMKNAFLDLCPQVKGEKYFLFLSRIHHKKGVDILVNAYLRLIDQYGDLPKLVIAGPGLDSSYGEKIKGLVNSNEKAKNSIYFPGMLSGDSKWGAFYGAEVFVLPSHQENFGIAVVEALACETPVLISKEVNIWREIESDSAGFVANVNLEETTQMLKSWLILSDDKKLEFRNNAKKCFEKYFHIVPAAIRMEKALREELV